MRSSVEKELTTMLAREISSDLDWLFINTIWRWDENAPRWKRWVASRWPFRCRSMWLGRKLGLGAWWTPPRPTGGSHD